MRWRVAVWTHPDSPVFEQREHSLSFITFTSTDPVEPRGRCVITVPAESNWQELISTQNPTDPSDTSMIRLYRDGVDNTDPPDAEYILKRFQKRILDDGSSVVVLFGVDWRLEALDQAVVRWWDWTPGAESTRQPDWLYGAASILTNSDFEESGFLPTIYELEITATGGTYTITDGTDTTSAIAWNASAITIEAELEADIAAIDDVLVTPGSTAGLFTIEFVNPGFGVGLNIGIGSLTGGGATLDETQTGSLQPTGWTKSQLVSSGVDNIFGVYDAFEVSSDQAHSGTQSLKIDPGAIPFWFNRWAGAQQVVTVQPGGLYQAVIWVYPTANEEYRFVIRGIDEDLIAFTQGTLTANTWNAMVISDIVIPDADSQVIFRIANIEATGNPATFYVDDAMFYAGLPAGNMGIIAQDLVDDLQIDHAPNREMALYLTPTWTATVDSSAAAWPRDESLVITRGKKYGTHVFGSQFADLGYEYDIIPGANPQTADWDFELWAEGNRGQTRTGMAFVVGMGVDGGMIAGRVPNATRWLGEGKNGIITEVANTAQEAATGVVEAYFGDPDIIDIPTLSAKAAHLLNDDLANRIAVNVELGEGSPIPYEEFDVGDIVQFQAAGHMDRHNRRISEIGLAAETNAEGETTWTPSITASKLFMGEAAINEAVYKLLRKFDRMPEDATGGAGFATGGKGGHFSIQIAAVDSTDREKAKADSGFQCTGVNDHIVIMFAMLECWLNGGGEVWLAAGTYYCAPDEIIIGYSLSYPEPIIIHGTGDATIIQLTAEETFYGVAVADGCKMEDVRVEAVAI